MGNPGLTLGETMLARYAIASVVLMSFSASSALGDVMLFGGGDNRVESMTNVTIAGTTGPNGVYNLEFHYGISYDQVQVDLGAVSPITWTTFADLLIVADAIAAEANAFGDVAGTDNDTNTVRIPYAEVGASLDILLAIHPDASSYGSWFTGEFDASIAQGTIPGPSNAWVTATVVPEPSSILLLCLAGLGVSCLSRK